jgi:hypothetical protein
MPTIERKFIGRCVQESDINEHMLTLFKYASKCSHITEAGVRGAVSSYAFAAGLLGTPDNKLVMIDIHSNDSVASFRAECDAEGVNTVFYEQSDLDCPMEPTDLLFIDTWHVYGQLKRELARWHPYAKTYIIMHDTTIDEYVGESCRYNMDATKQSEASGIPVLEIKMGLWPAIVEFLSNHPEWVLEKRYTNNNGLTILKRV